MNDKLLEIIEKQKQQIRDLQGKAQENEKVFLTANANFADERMRLEGKIRELQSELERVQR